MNRYKTKFIRYHSIEWELYVEMGWITWTVDDNGLAKMILHIPPRCPTTGLIFS